jgi:colanic acid/amylovoran biosynthesis glycosyltransferase
MPVAYILKRYPRFSETFVVSEILAHEAAGLDIAIYALRPPVDTHFQDIIARVKAPVTYLPHQNLRGSQFWQTLQGAATILPDLWSKLAIAQGEDVHDVHQAVLLAHQAVEQGITHFHAHFGTSATTVARLASHFSGIPYTFTAHAKDIFHRSVRPDDLQRKLNDAKAVVTISDYNRRYLQNHYDESAVHVQRIYNGLDLQQFSYQTPQDRPPRIVAVGRLVEKKGFADLITACGLLAKTRPDFSCHIIGHGELAAPLQQQIHQLGLQRWVTLLGPKPQADIKKAVQGAAVFAAPCVIGADGNRDGLPTVLLEAMALGTPCVSTDVTGITEVLTPGVTGLQVPQHHPAALATALNRLLGDGHLRVALARQARQRIVDGFDIHRNAAQIRQLFQGQDHPPLDNHRPSVLQEVS